MNWAMNAPDLLQKEAQRYTSELSRPVGTGHTVSQSVADALETIRVAKEQKTL
jgi:hypothetical protein